MDANNRDIRIGFPALKPSLRLLLYAVVVGVLVALQVAEAQQVPPPKNKLNVAIEECERATKQAADAAEKAANAERRSEQIVEQAKDAIKLATQAQRDISQEINISQLNTSLAQEAIKRIDGAVLTWRWAITVFISILGLSGIVGVIFTIALKAYVKDKLEEMAMEKKELKRETKESVQTVNEATDTGITAQLEASASLIQKAIENAPNLTHAERMEALAGARVLSCRRDLKVHDLAPNAVEQLGAMKTLAASALPDLREAMLLWKDDAALVEMIEDSIHRIEAAVRTTKTIPMPQVPNDECKEDR